MKIPIKRLDPELPLPARAHPGDAGLDLCAREAGRLQPGERRSVATGVAVAVPEGHVGLVAPRSGLAAEHGISVVNGPGVVDSGYRGEVKVILVNLGDEAWSYERGDRIGQLLVVPCESVVVEEAAELPPTPRGAGGFGSSGV